MVSYFMSFDITWVLILHEFRYFKFFFPTDSLIRFLGVVDTAWVSGALIFSIFPQVSKLLSVIGFLGLSFEFFMILYTAIFSLSLYQINSISLLFLVVSSSITILKKVKNARIRQSSIIIYKKIGSKCKMIVRFYEIKTQYWVQM